MSQEVFGGLPPAEDVPEHRWYKLHHKPTGMFYRPAFGFKDTVERKSSLSKRGHLYYSKGYLSGLTQYRDLEGVTRFINWSEWEIIEQTPRAGVNIKQES